MTIALRESRRAASATEAEAALARLELGHGVYFGVDAGIAGLHPLQAVLIEQPALALRIHGDRLEAEALTGWGAALLEQPPLAAWMQKTMRGAERSAIPALRGFLACFAPSPDVLLLGAVNFDAHRLATPGATGELLGTVFFAERLMRRNAAGEWREITLALDGAAADSATFRRKDVAPAAPIQPVDDHPPGGYAEMVRHALGLLRQRTLVSLTLSQSYRRRVAMPAAQAFARLRATNPAAASFFFNDGTGQRLFGASPDLQLVITSGIVQALPVCGTVGRRPGATGEAESVRELLNEEVDAASLAVCTDALRNDLAPLCEPGSLRLLDRRRPMSLATVVHAVDRLAGRLHAGADAWDAIVATAAPVMVTGTPRAAALAAIGQLEASPRGWYGGMMVQVASNGDALAGTILRAATVRGDVAEVRTGGDLLADSSPEREEQESRLKTLSLWRAFGLEASVAGPQAARQPQAALPASVRLVDHKDPFAAAVRDGLLGLGLELREDSGTAVLIGSAAAPAWPRERVVALGDAALDVLQAAGFAVEEREPEHGRLLHCAPTATAPWSRPTSFIAARYATQTLVDTELLPGWECWATGPAGEPVALAHAGSRVVALLFRPESLLSDPQALDVVAAAIAFAAR